MKLLQSVQIATQIYLKHAYPDGAPPHISEKASRLEGMKDSGELLSSTLLEKDDGPFCLRLGNSGYPHMKLVFTLEGERPVFYVDAHDCHFELPPNVEASAKLIRLRADNKNLKQRIEAGWATHHLAIFGCQAVSGACKSICVGMRILVIDDECQILEMLGLIIQGLGARVMRAQTVAEAQRLIAEKGVPHLVFCDIMMPEESGYDFVRWMREHHRGIPLCLITGLDQDKVDSRGAVKVLQKPFSAKNIVSLMKSIHLKRA